MCLCHCSHTPKLYIVRYYLETFVTDHICQPSPIMHFNKYCIEHVYLLHIILRHCYQFIIKTITNICVCSSNVHCHKSYFIKHIHEDTQMFPCHACTFAHYRFIIQTLIPVTDHNVKYRFSYILKSYV